MKHPMQPFVVEGGDNTIRFKANAIVQHLLDNGGIDMNKLAMLEFSQDDRTQFAQLIGYSLRGFHELPYVSDTDALQATQNARIQFKKSDIGGCRDDGCEMHCGVEEE